MIPVLDVKDIPEIFLEADHTINHVIIYTSKYTVVNATPEIRTKIKRIIDSYLKKKLIKETLDMLKEDLREFFLMCVENKLLYCSENAIAFKEQVKNGALMEFHVKESIVAKVDINSNSSLILKSTALYLVKDDVSTKLCDREYIESFKKALDKLLKKGI